jgi:osmotically-inducible protein OsmY
MNHTQLLKISPLGLRRVWLQGCVRSKAQAQALQQLVRAIDDLETVIDEMVVKEK